MKRTKKGFTLVEGMIGMLIISLIGMASILVASQYMRTMYAQDRQTKALSLNMNTVEKLNTEVHTLRELYEISNSMEAGELKLFAVGAGEIMLKEVSGMVTVQPAGNPEGYAFHSMVRPDGCLIRAQVSHKIDGEIPPNTKLTTIILIGGADGEET